FPLEIELVDGMGEGWYDRDWAELPEFHLLQQRGALGPKARVFDLGAHQGVIALLLSRYVGPEGTVLAVEANGHNAAAARRNIEINNAAQNCKVLHAAVAERSGKLTFSEGLNGIVDDGSGSWGQVEVDAFSIDDLASKYGVPSLIFIDVEGYECRALEGASKTLATRPHAFVEVHLGEGLESFGGSVERLLSYFSSSAYELYFNEENGAAFRPMREPNELPKHRFFLIAISRDLQARHGWQAAH
ncbi:MAG: FkbM family methyltransferase, partial [Bryobacterales bacterium]|nr:FkbM family methyltransferase [Bryobacterales bacterium]